MKIIDYTIHDKRMVTNNNFSSYVFVNADVEVEFEVNGETFTAYFQNGDYLYGDYDRPSSQFSEICDHSDKEVAKMAYYTESELEDEELIKELNEEFGRDWSIKEWTDLYIAIQDAMSFAYDEVIQPEKDRIDEEIKSVDEENFFVEVTEREPWGANDEDWRVCSEPRAYKFKTKDEAINFRDEEREKGNLAHLIYVDRYFELEGF